MRYRDINKSIENNDIIDRAKYLQAYRSFYFDQFMNGYKVNGMHYQQADFFLRKMWKDGKIACFTIAGTKLDKNIYGENETLKELYTKLNPEGTMCLAPFAPITYNIYDYPIAVNLINTRGATFIPTTPQMVDQEVVIGYANRMKKPVSYMVDYYIERIVDAEILIELNLNAHKTPFIIAISPEDKERMRALFEAIDSGTKKVYCELDDARNIQVLNTNTNYIVDKLYQYKEARENELRTYLGLNNVGGIEKKEHLITDEVNANNETIESSGDVFLDCMQEFCERVSSVLGYTISIEARHPKEDKMLEDEKESEDDEYESEE